MEHENIEFYLEEIMTETSEEEMYFAENSSITNVVVFSLAL